MCVPNLVPIGPHTATCIRLEGYTHRHTHTHTHTLAYIDIDDRQSYCVTMYTITISYVGLLIFPFNFILFAMVPVAIITYPNHRNILFLIISSSVSYIPSNVLCNPPVYLHVGRMRGVMHQRQSSVAIVFKCQDAFLLVFVESPRFACIQKDRNDKIKMYDHANCHNYGSYIAVNPLSLLAAQV